MTPEEFRSLKKGDKIRNIKLAGIWEVQANLNGKLLVQKITRDIIEDPEEWRAMDYDK